MNPYQELPGRAFWKLAVADKPMMEICQLWEPKFNIQKEHKIATYGSCFAQHIGNAMKKRQYAWLNTELAPAGMSEDGAKEFNYGIFSSRTGNIYTTSLLRQWVSWASGTPAPDEIWQEDERFIDPFRPRVEPNGFRSREELIASRNHTISKFRKSIESSNFFVFTLGLTESWTNKTKGYEYPMCPGTVAGAFNEDEHVFTNMSFAEVLEGLEASMEMMKKINPGLRFILTVSPVPLTATCSGKHVLVATMRSKSILRAVAGQLSEQRADVDYFPSYEIINSPAFRGSFFEDNLRNVRPDGVAFVMGNFFACLDGSVADVAKPVAAINEADKEKSDQGANDVFCDEEFLEAFSRQGA